MKPKQTSNQLLKKLEILPYNKRSVEESKSLIQLLKLAIQKDKKDYDELVENMDEGVAHCKIICDSEGLPYDYKFLSTNVAFEKQSGLTASQINGKTILEIFPDIEKFWINFYGNIALTLQPNSITKYNQNTNRNYTSSAYSSTKGEFTMLIKDITHRTELAKANIEITKGLERNSEVLSNMEDAFWHSEIICNDKGTPIDYKFKFANNSFESQTGIKVTEVIGKTVLEIFPDVEKTWIDIFGKVALNNTPTSFVKYNHNTDKYYQVNAFSPAKNEFAVFLRDISDNEGKRIELEKAYLKAEENDRLKSAFLANMSHEVRTPMNAILGFSNLLDDDAISDKDRKICLKQIKSSGNRLLTIISDIVDISKIDVDQQMLVYEECDLNLLIIELYNQYSILNKNPNISLKISNGFKAESFIIVTDKVRLVQILSNLIENALKYTIKGEIVFGYTTKKEHIEFFVKDSGIGIKKEDQKTVFERFGQIKNKASTVASGTGLGIPIAKGLVELFKGEIWLVSAPNKGTTFYFKIPHISSKEVIEKSYKYTILIAEDDDVNFLLLNLWLNSHFNIIRALNGMEAVQLFEKHNSIDLILMDIRMPYMDGIDATKLIRKSNIDIPIIAHTAYAMNEESISIRKAGCNRVLIKPFSRDQLINVLAQYDVII